MTDARPRLTLLELYHTLIPLDSDYAWGEFTTRIGWTDPDHFARRNDEFFAQYKAGTLDIHDYVRFATEAICRQGPQRAQAAHQQFMQEVIGPAIMPQALQLVAQHQQQGDQVLIVTATNEFVTRPIADAFAVPELIAVELERGADGWYNGEIHGVPSAREGKVPRVAEWLRRHNSDWGDVYSTFYTDSFNDIALMEKVDCPVATNPDDRLRAHALQRGWRILNLFDNDKKTD